MDDWFEFRPNDEYSTREISEEIFKNHIYEKHYAVKEGDVVLDIGANVGAFTYSILHKNPSRVVAVEPSNAMFASLEHNCGHHPAVRLECAAIDDFTMNSIDIPKKAFIFWNQGGKYNTITFERLLYNHNITHVDLMKFDCEGGEFSIFTEENREFIQKNIKNLAGEWHFSEMENAAERFFTFRDRFLKGHEHHVYERDGKEVTGWIFDDIYIRGFMKWFNQHNAQLLVYLRN